MKNTYVIKTEADCEGRSMKTLGTVMANSPEHAVKYMYHIGKKPYYDYTVEIAEPVLVACPEEELKHLVSVDRSNSVNMHFLVETNKEVYRQKRDHILEVLKSEGLTYEDVVNFGKELDK